MNFGPDIFGRMASLALIFVVVFAFLSAVLYLVHFLLTLPMRRAERARLFLDLIQTAIQDGRPIEETLVSISHSREPAVGVRFHALAAWLEAGLGFGEALGKVPRLVPPQVSAMLKAGQQMGDIGKVLPACRQLLADATSEARSAVPYIFMITLATTPVAWLVLTFVLPKFREIAPMYGQKSEGLAWLASHGTALLRVQTGMVTLLLLAALLYVGGPRVVRWFPFLQRLHYHLPWRRKRMQRDFSTMLGILLDSGVAEPEALRLAGECAANRVFARGAGRVIARLGQGVALPQALESMDETGELGWRLRNAFYARTKFLRALAGWHESLAAKAFQQEQAAAQWITSALVIWNGLFVGTIVVSVFLFLVSIINAAVLW